MIKDCVTLNGQVINIGPWDYMIQQVQVGERELEPAEYDEEGNLIKEAVVEPLYEDQVTNLLPEGAIVEQMEVSQTADGGFKAESADSAVRLQVAKDAKIAELDAACNAAILAGFDYTINGVSYRFSLSVFAQINFRETDASFKDGSITSETWTVVNNTNGKVERVTLDQATFNGAKNAGKTVVRDNISRLRDVLQLQVESAATQAEVEAVVW